MKKFITTFVAFAVAATAAQAQTLSGSWPAEGGKITVTADGGTVNAAGLDFISANDGLIPIDGGAAAPFTFLLSNTASQVTYGNLGTSVAIEGSLELSVGANAGAEVAATWGDGATPVSFDVTQAGGEGGGGEGGGGEGGGGEGGDPCGDAPVCAIFPPEGGAITIKTTGPIDAAGLDFISTNDGLVPIPPGDLTASAAPFTFLLANSSSQVTYGNLGTSVTIDGELELSVGATAGAEISATWGDGATPVAFPVGSAGPVVPEPATGLMAAFAALGMLGFRRGRK